MSKVDPRGDADRTELGRDNVDFSLSEEICVRTLCTFTKCYKKSRSFLIPTGVNDYLNPRSFFTSILNFITHSDIDRVLRRYSD